MKMASTHQLYPCVVCDKLYASAESATKCFMGHAIAANSSFFDVSAAGPSTSQELSYAENESLPEISNPEDTSTLRSSHGGSRNLHLWNDSTTELFLSEIKEKYQLLTSRTTSRMSVWRSIHEALLHEMPGVTIKQLQDKWKNLKASFYKFRDNTTRTGSARIKKPPQYELLCSFLAERPLSQPITVSCGLSEELPNQQEAVKGQLMQEDSQETLSVDSAPPDNATRRPRETPSEDGRPKKKKRNIRPPSLAETVKSLQKDLMKQHENFHKENAAKLDALIETQQKIIANDESFRQNYIRCLQERNEILSKLLHQND